MIKLARVLIFGKRSIITKEFVNYCNTKSSQIKIIDSSKIIKNFKINENNILKYIENYRPNIIINNISIKNLSFCEKNKKKSFILNVKFSDILNQITQKKKIYYIFFSTASLFENYKYQLETFDVKCKPKFKNYYAKTKLFAENKIKMNKKGIIIRTSNLYSINTKNFIYKLCLDLKKNKKIKAKYNCYFTPVNTRDLVGFIITKIFNNLTYYCKKKIIHFSENNTQNRYEFFKKAEKYFNKKNLVSKDFSIKDSQINTSLKCNVRYNFFGFKYFLKKI
jgi:dTDP-4-dehydrorhamnose reductase